MANPNGLLPLPEYSGIIAQQWQARLQQLQEHRSDIPPELLRMLEMEFYLGHLICYNAIMNATRHSPAVLALITKALEKELNLYFQQPQGSH